VRFEQSHQTLDLTIHMPSVPRTSDNCYSIGPQTIAYYPRRDIVSWPPLQRRTTALACSKSVVQTKRFCCLWACLVALKFLTISLLSEKLCRSNDGLPKFKSFLHQVLPAKTKTNVCLNMYRYYQIYTYIHRCTIM